MRRLIAKELILSFVPDGEQRIWRSLTRMKLQLTRDRVRLQLAIIFADWGKPAEAESVYAEMMARARREYVAPGTLAIAASAVGMLDEALCHAREAFEIRDPFCRIDFSKYWPDSARLRADPRFQEILLEFRLD